MFSYEFCEVFKCIHFGEYQKTTASGVCQIQRGESMLWKTDVKDKYNNINSIKLSR